MMLQRELRRPTRFLSCPALSRVGAPHAFFTRHGSATLLPSSASAEFQVRQVHGSTAITLEATSVPSEIRFREADALITAIPGQRVAIRTADCVPILIFDPRRNVAAAIHAGWRGLVAGVVETTLRLLFEQHRCRPHDLLAAVGPAIGRCHFEVGDDVALHFASVPGAVSRNGGARPHVDLPRVVTHALEAHALGHVSSTPDCTYCEPQLYHSYRRDGADAGRQLSVVGTRPLV